MTRIGIAVLAASMTLGACGHARTTISVVPSMTATPSTPTDVPSDPKAAMLAWEGETGISALYTSLADALNQLLEASATMYFNQDPSACREVYRVIAKLQAVRPSPSAELNVEMRGMIDDFKTAMNRCEIAVSTFDLSTVDPEDINAVTEALNGGIAHMNAMLKISTQFHS